MKPVSEQRALVQLTRIREGLRTRVIDGYEHRAKDCLTCDTPGACCLDSGFVNVRISRLEARQIHAGLRSLPASTQQAVRRRIEAAVERYELSAQQDPLDQKFACPLYGPATGCLVHSYGKPIPCLMHACYEDLTDLPPDELSSDAEIAIERLNTRAYGRSNSRLPLPLALREWEA